jgi:hypothetical protein
MKAAGLRGVREMKAVGLRSVRKMKQACRAAGRSLHSKPP